MGRKGEERQTTERTLDTPAPTPLHPSLCTMLFISGRTISHRRPVNHPATATDTGSKQWELQRLGQAPVKLVCSFKVTCGGASLAGGGLLPGAARGGRLTVPGQYISSSPFPE